MQIGLCRITQLTSYLKDFNDLFEELREKKVGIFGICAEAQQELADQAVKDWGLHYQCFTDPTHVLRNYLSKEGLVTIRITGGEDASDSVPYTGSYPRSKITSMEWHSQVCCV